VNGFTMPKDEEFIQLLKEKQPKILVITEDWCGDAMINNGILRNIVDEANLDARTVLRDKDTDLIDRYLTNGGRAIPIYVFLSAEGEVLGKWGPRAPELQAYVMTSRETLPSKEAANFEEAQKELYAKISEENASNEQFWNWVYNSQREALLAAIQ
ncbi:MAG: thioredoxin family protein, partial [Kurthia sp.]